MWIGVLWAGLRVAMWITHLGGKFRHGLLEKSLISLVERRNLQMGKRRRKDGSKAYLEGVLKVFCLLFCHSLPAWSTILLSSLGPEADFDSIP